MAWPKGKAKPKLTEKLTCSKCGRDDFEYASAYTRHTLHCDGKAAQSRIAARSRSLAVPVSQPQTRSQNRQRHAKPSLRRKRGRIASDSHTDRTPPAAALSAIQGAATDKAMELVIAGLRAKRDRIDQAIVALEAVE